MARKPLLLSTFLLLATLSGTLWAFPQGGSASQTGQQARNYPEPTQGDFVIRDFKFDSGETLPELRLHYRTIGQPKRDASGVVRNAALIMHGTGGSGAGFLSGQYAGSLFGPGQLLDATKYFII